MKAIFVSLLCLVLASACSKNEPAATERVQPQSTASASTAERPPKAPVDESPVEAAVRPADDRPILDVNGEKVYRAEFEAAVGELPANMRGVLSTDFGKRALADEIVRLKLLEQEGNRLQVTRDPDVARRIDMETSKIIASAAVERIVNEKNSDAELRKLYEEAKPRLQVVQARQIVVAYAGGALQPKSGAPLNEEAAMKRAQELLDRVRGGEEFSNVAARESDDPQARTNGGVITVVPGQAPRDFEATLFAMKPDEIRGPMKTPIAIHVVQMLNKQSRKFEEVRPVLLQELRSRKIDSVVKELRSRSKVTLDPQYFGPEPQKKGSK